MRNLTRLWKTIILCPFLLNKKRIAIKIMTSYFNLILSSRDFP